MAELKFFFQDIINYQDSLGFIGGHPTAPGSGRQSDNAGMFTAEMLRIAYDLDCHEDTASNMRLLLDAQGTLHRYPGDSSPDLSPDNILGFLNYCSLYDNREPSAQLLLTRGLKGFGSYTTPWSRDGFLFRQPQLITAMLAASGRLSWWKLYYLPLVVYTALVIAVAGHGVAPEDNQDARRLSWHLIQIMKTKSFLCRLASKIWWRRLRLQYGDQGMRLVFGRYFDMNHPFAKFAVNEWER